MSCQSYHLPRHLNASIWQSHDRITALLQRVTILISEAEDPDPTVAARVKGKAAKAAEEAMIKEGTFAC